MFLLRLNFWSLIISEVIVFVVLGWSNIGKQFCTFLIKKEKEKQNKEEKRDHALI